MIRNRCRVLLFVLVAMSVNAIASDADISQVVSDHEARCAALGQADFSNLLDAPTQILQTQSMKAGAGESAYCLVSGYIAPSVGFKMGLPAEWNGRFMEVGCGGHCGSLPEDEQFGQRSACSALLHKGYACVASDMGHKGARAGLWAFQNLQAKLDWGYRATHVVALAGKAITAWYFQTAPRYSYFMGGSTGGRQALQAAQRFPWDFDGIVAIAPPVDLSAIYMTFAWGYQALHDKEGQPLLGEAQLKLLTEAALAQCDLDDDVKDRVIGDPLHCAFDPAELACATNSTTACLTPVQLAAVNKIYAGPMNSKGEKLTAGGPVVGSELGEWDRSPVTGWNFAYLGGGKGLLSGGYSALASDGLRNLFFWPELESTWQLGDFDFDRDSRRMGVMQALYDSSNPDLRVFRAAGGKLLIAQGLNDNSVLPRKTIDYYETVERTMGGREATQSFVRLFLLPGVGHTLGGEGADRVDYMSAIEAWVEEGRAPDRLIASRLKDADWKRPVVFPLDPAAIQFTRPLYPYPARAKYKGRGDPSDAANFVRIVP